MISGALNEKLLPIVRASIKNLDGEWREFDFLLDTGSEHDLMLSESTVRQHRIAVRPYCDAPASIDPLQLPSDSLYISPFWVEALLNRQPRIVKAEIIKADKFAAVIGPSLLWNRRLTIDVVENGAVVLDCIPALSPLAHFRSQFRKRERQYPLLDYRWNLPWVNVIVNDSQGRRRCFSANVDTGDSGELSLPPSKVEELGLDLPDICLITTPDGEFQTTCGEAEMIWQGNPLTVECIQRSEENPPLIGMKLLYGNRITIDFDCLAPAVRIDPIRQSRLARTII